MHINIYEGLQQHFVSSGKGIIKLLMVITALQVMRILLCSDDLILTCYCCFIPRFITLLWSYCNFCRPSICRCLHRGRCRHHLGRGSLGFYTAPWFCNTTFSSHRRRAVIAEEEFDGSDAVELNSGDASREWSTDNNFVGTIQCCVTDIYWLGDDDGEITNLKDEWFHFYFVHFTCSTFRFTIIYKLL